MTQLNQSTQFELTQFVARPLPGTSRAPRLEPVTQSSSLWQRLFRYFPRPQRRLYLGWFGGVQIYYKGGQP
jgi:hypothetical protein